MNEQQEKLFGSLAEIDGGLIEEAYKIDNAKKLRRYSEDEKGVSVTKIRRYNILGRVAVAVACLCLCVITVFAVLPRLNTVTPPLGGDETPAESTGGDNIDRNPSGLPEELIAQLISVESSDEKQGDVGEFCFSMSFDLIKNGYHLLLVEYNDRSQYYFVAAYYTSDDGHYERDHCCREKYTWVKFEKANEITEYYNGEKIVCSYQIDVASSCRDMIAPERGELSYMYCRPYWPIFVPGGVYAPDGYEQSEGMGIVLSDSTGDTVYDSRMGTYMLSLSRYLGYENIDGEHYISIRVEVSGDDEHSLQKRLKRTLGDYYDHLIDGMRCSVMSESNSPNTGKKIIQYLCSFKLNDVIKATEN